MIIGRAIPSIVGFIFAASVLAGAESPLRLIVQPERVEVQFKNRPLLVYAFGRNQFKPYVRELDTLQGDNVLQDAPPDHLHHHGLMYAVGVNGINFWEERAECGYERPGKVLVHSTGTTPDGLPQAEFSQRIDWIAPKDKERPDTAPVALLVERRTITVTVDEAAQEVALRWRAQFEPGPGAQKITLGGAAYDGLGLRFPKDFDRVARRQNSEGLPYSAEGKWDVTPARWSSVAGTVHGHEISVALFGQPGESSKFFSMLNPFTYLTVTQGLDQAPREYRTGESFHLDYLLTVGSTPQTPGALEGRYQRWMRKVDPASR